MKNQKKLQIIILSFLVAILFFGCASRISTGTNYDIVKYPDIGFLAFKFNSSHMSFLDAISNITGDYDLEIKNVNSNESFVFSLNDDKPNSFAIFVGPFKIYEKYFEKYTDLPLKLVPLPAGKYCTKYIYQRKVHGRSLMFIKKEEIEIQKDKLTYIGTFEFSTRYFLLFPCGYHNKFTDDGIERAKSMNLENYLIKNICKLK